MPAPLRANIRCAAERAASVPSVIDVQDAVKDVPHFDSVCSVRRRHERVESLREDSRFVVNVAGISAGGVAIYTVRFGQGSVTALIVGGPHAMEPMGSLTVFSLMHL